jgi:2-methylcitrate dehydratase PrpD
MAALLAEQGFPAGAEILSAERGGLFRLYSDRGEPDATVAGLGDRWELETISLRLWPAASSIQSVITSMFALIDEHDLRPEQVERIDVGLSRTVYDMHGTLPWDNKFRALLSTPYVTGVVLHDRKCWFEQFRPERLGDAALNAFIRERIDVAVDEKVEGTGAAVTVRTKDGRVLSDRRKHPRGDSADPLSREEIVGKFRESAVGLLPAANVERAIDMIVGIADVPNVADLLALLARPARAA